MLPNCIRTGIIVNAVNRCAYTEPVFPGKVQKRLHQFRFHKMIINPLLSCSHLGAVHMDDPVGPQLIPELAAVIIVHIPPGSNHNPVMLPQPLHCLQGLLAVGGLAHHDTVQGRPVHSQDNALSNQLLILHNQYLQHGVSSS